ncbi:MAG: methyl-accepting chemotaxis protein [Aureliella sp.]
MALVVKNTDGEGKSVLSMVDDIANAVNSAVGDIEAINTETRVLAMNARIEAAHAGSNGAAFGIVAEHMQHLAHKTSAIAHEMSLQTSDRTPELRKFITTTVRGTRLGDIALTNIDLIDRNLYERTCDVRWWATDSSLVDALEKNTIESHEYASRRMGVILGAYTVYHDLVLCNAEGKIIANACPENSGTIGCEQSSEEWFYKAMATRSGDEYAFQSAHRSNLVNNAPALIYSCAVREDGDGTKPPIGALGIIFNWEGLAHPIFDSVPMERAELDGTRCMIVTSDRRILASNGVEEINQKLQLRDFERVLGSERGFFETQYEGRSVVVGHAHAPGFETYSTGWYSLVIQDSI